ncbi:MAG: FHA domain-containing protein [Kiloniellales bacterium]|nr:FHA domain-containing protein [Kiloniellales bacterium]
MKTVVVGRSPYADVVLADASVARRHVEVVITDDGRYFVTDCATETGCWRRVSADQGRDHWEKLRQSFVSMEDHLRLGDHHCTLKDLLRDVDLRDSAETGPGGGGAGRGGDAHGGGAAGGADRRIESLRGRVERDPVTGEIIPKRL